MKPREPEKPLKPSVHIALFGYSALGAVLGTTLHGAQFFWFLLWAIIGGVLLIALWSPHPYQEMDGEDNET